jgi:Reverse transcriptase (RNA-dependent DNA polymerase)
MLTLWDENDYLESKGRLIAVLKGIKIYLLAKEYTQKEEFDYFDTFNSVTKSATVRIMLTIFLTNQWPLHQLDVNNEFLHDDLEEIVYME